MTLGSRGRELSGEDVFSATFSVSGARAPAHQRVVISRCLAGLREAEDALNQVRWALAEMGGAEDEGPDSGPGTSIAGAALSTPHPAGESVGWPARRASFSKGPADRFHRLVRASSKEVAGGTTKHAEAVVQTSATAQLPEPTAAATIGLLGFTGVEAVDNIVLSTINARMKERNPGAVSRRNDYADGELGARLLSAAIAAQTPNVKQHEPDPSAATQIMADDIIWQKIGLGCIKLPLIHPEARFRAVWMVLGFTFILYELFAIPVYIAFDVKPVGGLFVFASMINAYFLTDMCLSFFCSYRDAAGFIILSPAVIACSYMKSWFVPDMVASIPWEWIVLEDQNGSAKLTRGVRVVRTLRMLRLLRLMRVAKLQNALATLQARVESHHVLMFAIGVFQVCLVLFAVCHWCACLWYGIGVGSDFSDASYQDGQVSWVVYYQNNPPYIGYDKGQHYIYSMYFCLTTMATVGYGDISPKNYDEVCFTLFLLVSSSVLFAGLMGTLMNMLSDFYSHHRAMNDKKVMLSRYMRFRAVPWKLLMSVRQHLLFLWDANSGFDTYEEELKVQLSPVLKGELSYHIYGRVLTSAPFLAWMKDFPSCTRYLAERVRSLFLTPGDHIVRMGHQNKEIFILLTGKAAVSRVEHLFDQETEPAMPHADDLTFDIPRSKEERLGAVMAQAQGGRRYRSKHGVLHTGVDTFDSVVLERAAVELRLTDIRREVAARAVQRTWRRQIQRRSVNAAQLPQDLSRWLKIDRMTKRDFSAPAYFGESCLFQTLEDWGRAPPPTYMYSVRCESRGELVYIPRVAIQDLLTRFSPWMPERLEMFQEAVRTKLGNMLREDSNFREIVADWAHPSD